MSYPGARRPPDTKKGHVACPGTEAAGRRALSLQRCGTKAPNDPPQSRTTARMTYTPALSSARRHRAFAALFVAFAVASGLAPATARADAPIPLDRLPAAVTKTLVDYFPRSRNLSAERDGEDAERSRYTVRLRYRAITLSVEVTPQGRVTDVAMDKAPR